MVYMCFLFRGAVLGVEEQCLKVLGLSLRDRAVVMVVVLGVVPVVINMTLNPHGGGFGFRSHSSSGPRFPPRGVHFPQMGHGMFGVFSNTFLGQMSQHWYPS
jgi:hypothetical protein